MTRLECSVTSCGNNAENCCCKSDIEISGSHAQNSKQTCCSSYIVKSSTAANSVGTYYPNPELDIRCDAFNCTHNCQGACAAESISVDFNGCSSLGGSECNTFKKARD